MQRCGGSQSPTSCHRAGGHCVSYNQNPVGSCVWVTLELNILTVTLWGTVFVLVQMCREPLDLKTKDWAGSGGHTASCNIMNVFVFSVLSFHLICHVFMVFNKCLK